MQVSDQTGIVWRRSSRCESGTCVEVAVLQDGNTLVRDSKQNSDGPVLRYAPNEWKAFIEGVKKGEFDIVDQMA